MELEEGKRCEATDAGEWDAVASCIPLWTAALRFDVLEALVALARDLVIERWRLVGTCIVIIHVLIYGSLCRVKLSNEAGSCSSACFETCRAI